MPSRLSTDPNHAVACGNTQLAFPWMHAVPQHTAPYACSLQVSHARSPTAAAYLPGWAAHCSAVTCLLMSVGPYGGAAHTCQPTPQASAGTVHSTPSEFPQLLPVGYARNDASGHLASQPAMPGNCATSVNASRVSSAQPLTEAFPAPPPPRQHPLES